MTSHEPEQLQPAPSRPIPDAGLTSDDGLGVMHRTRLAAAARAVPYPIVRDVLGPTIVSRVALTLVGLLSLSLLRRDALADANPAPDWVVRGGATAERVPDWLQVWSRWDGGWYVSIARDGYSFAPGQESNVAFFPLYPLLMRLLGGIGDSFTSYALAGVLISNVALVVALALLVMLVRLDLPHATAARTAWYVLLFPTSLFLSAVYSDSLFLALVLGTFYLARTNRWWLVAPVGFLAALTRPPGFLLVIPLLVEYLYQREFDLRRIRADVLALLAIPAGTAAYFAYLASQFGSFDTWFRAQSAWGSGTTMPWDTLAKFFSQPLSLHRGEHSIIDFAFAVLFVALVVVCWRVLRPSYAVCATVFLLTTVTAGVIESIPRYGLSYFPVFIVLAIAGADDFFDRVYTVVCLTLSGLFMAMFAQWYWVS